MAYATLADVRALPRMAVAQYTDDQINEGLAYAEATVDEYCGTSFEYKSFTFTFTACGSAAFAFGFGGPIFIRTITSVTEDGTTVDESDYTISSDGFSLSGFTKGKEYVVTGTAGQYATAPQLITTATAHLAAYYVRSLHNALPDGALQVISDQGTILIAQPGVRGPSGVPMVNSILNRYRVDTRWF